MSPEIPAGRAARPPSFHTSSPRALLVRGLLLLALCSAMLGGFLRHVSHAPRGGEGARAAAVAASERPKT